MRTKDEDIERELIWLKAEQDFYLFAHSYKVLRSVAETLPEELAFEFALADLRPSDNNFDPSWVYLLTLLADKRIAASRIFYLSPDSDFINRISHIAQSELDQFDIKFKVVDGRCFIDPFNPEYDEQFMLKGKLDFMRELIKQGIVDAVKPEDFPIFQVMENVQKSYVYMRNYQLKESMKKTQRYRKTLEEIAEGLLHKIENGIDIPATEISKYIAGNKESLSQSIRRKKQSNKYTPLADYIAKDPTAMKTIGEVYEKLVNSKKV